MATEAKIGETDRKKRQRRGKREGKKRKTERGYGYEMGVSR